MTNENLLSTKFILSVLYTVLGGIGLFTDKLSFEQFSTLTAPILGAYFIANVVEKTVMSKINKK